MFTGEKLQITQETLISEVNRAFSQTLAKQDIQEEIEFAEITLLEKNVIFQKIITGDKNIEIGKLIGILHNSDWVRQGLTHFEKTRHICPFCQQQVDENTEKQLREFFNKQFEQDIASLGNLITDYIRLTDDIVNRIYVISNETVEGYESSIDRLLVQIREIIEQNVKKLLAKQNEPSVEIELISICELIKLVNIEIEKRNSVITENNRIVAYRKDVKNELSDRAFSFIANNLLFTILNRYHEDIGNNGKARSKIMDNVETDSGVIRDAKNKIAINERKLTSIVSTAISMQNLLTRFGYTSFMITTTDDERNFRLIRPNGEYAQETLSDGEFRFISFLYFYYLVNGSDKPSMSDKKKVIIIDDPICSMDNQALFLSLGLIHHIIEKCLNIESISQIIVSTHNLFFYLNLIEPYRKPSLRTKKINLEEDVSYIHLKRVGEYVLAKQCKKT